ncbi:MAG TPA: flagellin [Bryobacteraceae bacterium]|nr:flagellin [Bryobacteraceae bacterium]
MSFSINTNVASLQAQNYLRVNSNFQSKTIEQVTSGLKIVNSGDDAAGLAIANSYRSTEAVLTQGVQNANDGLSQLQIMDGGISNISQLLDRARTLATQSASGTFAGGTTGRQELNGEFQSVLSEIDRQAQSIGLNQGGQYAKTLGVFIGGGQGTNSASVIANGTVSVNLSNSTVDTQGLGLKGFTAGWQATPGTTDTGLYNLNAGAKSSGGIDTSVSGVLTNATNAGIVAGNGGNISFTIMGPGFSAGAGGAITITASMKGVADTATLTAAINAGIASAGLQGNAQAQAFAAANVTAQIHTGADGAQQLQFVSPSSAFEVTAGDSVANALMGNFLAGSANGNNGATTNAQGAAITGHLASFVSQGTQQISGTINTTNLQEGPGLAYASLVYSSAATVNETQTLTFAINDSTGTPQTASVTLNGTAGAANVTAAGAIQQINAALQSSNSAAVRGIVAVVDNQAAGSEHISFASSTGSAFNVTIGQAATSTTSVADGLAGYNTIVQSTDVGSGASADISTASGAQAAVTALANSVSNLGNAQAVVGRGENQFNYAINLAQSQLTNLATAESGIRDANLATAAANLTKAQILMQAGVAALAQANSAPQAILSLLKG